MAKGKGKKVSTPSSKKATLVLPPSKYFRGRSNQFSKMGAYALRFMELHAEGVGDLSDTDDAFISSYRYALAAKIVVRCPVPPSSPTLTISAAAES